MPPIGADADLCHPNKEDGMDFLASGVLQRADGPSVPYRGGFISARWVEASAGYTTEGK